MINECNTNIFEIYLHSYQNSSYEHPWHGGTPGVDCFSIFRDSSHVNWQFNKFSGYLSKRGLDKYFDPADFMGTL